MATSQLIQKLLIKSTGKTGAGSIYPLLFSIILI